jgi:transcriptional regulator with XRE-family HTH domain
MNRPWSEQLTLGEMIRKQRELAALPMRQLAEMAGISNPYLSQIERGLRAPSDQVLNAIADSLQMSAESLRPPEDENRRSAVAEAIAADPDLTAEQQRALQQAYEAFRQVTVERRKAQGRRSGQNTTTTDGTEHRSPEPAGSTE